MLYRDSNYSNGMKDDHQVKGDGCVEINIRCGEQEYQKKDDNSSAKPEYDKDLCQKNEKYKNKNESCVVINIFCEHREGKGKDAKPQQP